MFKVISRKKGSRVETVSGVSVDFSPLTAEEVATLVERHVRLVDENNPRDVKVVSARVLRELLAGIVAATEVADE